MSFLQSLDWSVVWTYLPALLRGLFVNLMLTVVAFLGGGLILGSLLAAANLSSWRLVRWPALLFVEVWRATPLLVQAIWMHFAFPALTGIATTPLQSATLALVFNVAAYCSEIIRGGILGVPKGQREAASALGLRAPARWRLVILPQALRLVVPPLVGTTISIFKATAILSILAIDDLMRVAARVSGHTFQPVEIYTAAAALAFLVGFAITRAGARIERHFAEAGR